MSSYDDNGRVCTKCHEYKPYSEYHKHKGCVNGYNTVCKACRRLRSVENWRNVKLEKRILQRTKSRATLKGLEFDLELEDIVVPTHCPVLGIEISEEGHVDSSPSIDRTNPNKGYTKDNIIIMSNRANVLKNNGTLEEFERLIKYLRNQNEL